MDVDALMLVAVFSSGIKKIPYLASLLGLDIAPAKHVPRHLLAGVAGWGCKPNTARARAYAQRQGVPYIALEDGFLRSFGTGDRFPPIALVVDELGIYYDCTRPSALERLLASDTDVLQPDAAAVARARNQLVQQQLSKYNHAPALDASVLRPTDRQRVLVVDQTAGDVSVGLGGANAHTFVQMLQAALQENPQATIYVKTHPEVTSGRKAGYLTNVQDDQRTVVLRDAVNPQSLIAHMDRVYVVSSTMGFEALLAGKAVTCFGVPWYAGWGATDDRQPMHPAMQRRAAGEGRTRTVDELFAAAYMHYTRYLDPVSKKRGSMGDAMAWLQQQRCVSERFGGRMICIGFPRWRAWNFHAMLSLHADKLVFARNAKQASKLRPEKQDALVCWGRVPPAGVEALAQQCGVRLFRMEDGFVRSVGLGSDLIPPLSFVLDERGIYFDPGRPSDLEHMLNTRELTAQDLQRARKVREFIVRHRISKYNIEPVTPVQWLGAQRPGAQQPGAGRTVVLVPGQVEDDASIRFGCDAQGVHTNMGLLQAAREQFPKAFIVYKPHPDVVSGNRRGKLALQQAMQYADAVETQASVVSCVEACDVVVTMTSLTGFDALLRGKRVVVHGRPFYAGWGLTEDVLPVPRRLRQRSLDELVFCVLIAYPLYWDPVLKGYTSCEAVLEQLCEERDALVRSGGLHKLSVGYVARQWRKLKVLCQAFFR